MGSRLSRLRARNTRRVLLVGLDGAGKTSLVRHYAGRGAAEAAFAAPTSAPAPTDAPPAQRDFEVFTISLPARKAGVTVAGAGTGTAPRPALELQVWDVGGRESLRPYWRHYYTGSQGVVFVVDASPAGASKLPAAAAELAALAADEQLADAAMLVVANRSASPGALGEATLAERLALARALSAHPWRLAMCDTQTGQGLDEGLAWLGDAMKDL
jgi:ADP-ribosylation factor protein 6